MQREFDNCAKFTTTNGSSGEVSNILVCVRKSMLFEFSLLFVEQLFH
jgi:hypothetical protein